MKKEIEKTEFGSDNINPFTGELETRYDVKKYNSYADYCIKTKRVDMDELEDNRKEMNEEQKKINRFYKNPKK